MLFQIFSVSSALFETLLRGKQFTQTKLASRRDSVPSPIVVHVVVEQEQATERLMLTLKCEGGFPCERAHRQS